MTLAEFLLARIAEDEAVARTATSGPWYVDEVGDFGDKSAVLEVARWRGYTNTVNLGEDRPTADHIARHDPARVLAECEAKRAIIDEVTATEVRLCSVEKFHVPTHPLAEPILRHLAAVYADHPDYDEAWRA